MHERAPSDRGGQYRFGVFEFDGETLELKKNGRTVALRPQPLKLLALLLARPNDLISRDDLQRALWAGDTFVDFEQGLNHAIRELRAVLGDVAESPRFIQTLPRRGYRFIAPVEHVAVPAPPIPAPGRDHAVTSKRWPAVAAVVGLSAILVIVAVFNFRPRVQGAGNVNPPASLIVRPFSAPSDTALGIGLANAITIRLGGQPILAVRSATAAAGDGDSQWPPGVTHALDGEIAIRGTDVTVLARLQDASGRAVWSERCRSSLRRTRGTTESS